MYIRPPENYDFTSNPSYKKLHNQSSNPPVGLIQIVEKTHYYLDFVYDNESILNKFFPNYDSKEFNSIGCSDGRINIVYATISFDIELLGITEHCKDRIRANKLNSIGI
jgi:hypothetical protein